MRNFTPALVLAFQEWQIEHGVHPKGPGGVGHGFVTAFFDVKDAAAVDGWLKANKVRAVKR
jgi:hypothetical protein